METLAVAVSDNANKIANCIRGELSEDKENSAVPVIQEDFAGVDIFITPAAKGYTIIKSEKTDALELAEKNIIAKINDFDFENQLIVNL